MRLRREKRLTESEARATARKNTASASSLTVMARPTTQGKATEFDRCESVVGSSQQREVNAYIEEKSNRENT
jgi:hypothetical protein